MQPHDASYYFFCAIYSFIVSTIMGESSTETSDSDHGAARAIQRAEVILKEDQGSREQAVDAEAVGREADCL